jgi:hypothetical protein
MITTTYTCDRCGHWQNNDKQMWYVGAWRAYATGGAADKSAKLMWFRQCCDEFPQLFPPPKPKPDVPVPVAPTLEDLFRELIRNEMEIK